MNKVRVLIIDDEIEICLNMKDMFSFEGWEADYATTAKEAFQKINENGHDLILADIKLEGRVSGIDIIKSFLDKDKKPKIIVISAIPRDALNPTFVKEGIVNLISGYLDKPNCSNPDKLMQLSKHVLQQ
jgi:DNA-binding NtrC family response regulator